MKQSSKQLVKPSDAVSWVSCSRRVWLDNRDNFEAESIEDEFEQLIIHLGLEHERNVLNQLAQSLSVHTATSQEHTQQLMKAGVDVIYQAQLQDQENRLVGFPDFLIKGANGDYQPADAKLSLSADKKPIQIQLDFYRRLLNTSLPGIVFLGDGSKADIGDEANAITDHFITEMRSLLEEDCEPLVRYSHSKCRACPYYNHCKPTFEAKEELSLLYGIQSRAAKGLEDAGIASPYFNNLGNQCHITNLINHTIKFLPNSITLLS